MCARLKIKGQVFKPGEKVPVKSAGESQTKLLLWDGFAREESRGIWAAKGARSATVEADGFAERHDKTRELVWAEKQGPFIVNVLSLGETMRVVTREATAEEILHFGHSRMPKTQNA